MNPFFFGSSKSPLYGVYHPPRAGTGGKAVLACYPMGAEYMRAHRAFRQLTTLLVKAGAHVLRFDYFGTGDSAGDGTEATIERWTEDIGVAIEELKEMSQAKEVVLVGLRFGATLAALASTGRTDVEQLVMWDPIVDGRQYVDEMLSVHRSEQQARGGAVDTDVAGVHGFPLPPALRTAIAAVDLRTWSGGNVRRIDAVTSSEQAAVDEMVAGLMGRGRAARGLVCPSSGQWAESDAFGSALIPHGIIQGVIGCIVDQGVEQA